MLEPTLLFFHGQSLRSSFLRNLNREQSKPDPDPNSPEHCLFIRWEGKRFPKPFSSTLLFFNHTSRGWFFRQWDVVAPVLKSLRGRGLLPTLDTSWEPLKSTDWPRA